MANIAKMKVVAISGGFDPIHKGHIEYIKRAKDLGDVLICILNSDEFLQKKKGFVFQKFDERKAILESVKYIDMVVPCLDDDQTVRKTLEVLRPHIFAKGGDRTKENIPEHEICEELDILIIDGLGEKIQSSSKLVERSTF